MKIYAIVEGQGDVAAFPVLLRRLVHEYAQCYGVQIGMPVRKKQQFPFCPEGQYTRGICNRLSQTFLTPARGVIV